MKTLRSIFYFWKKPKQIQMEKEQIKSTITEELFCENNPDFSQLEQTNKLSHNPLMEFKSRDFMATGYKKGFEEHSADALENGQLKLKAEFRNILQIMKDKNKSEIFVLKNEIVDAHSISERLTKKLELRIEQIESNINTMDYELELSVLNEGFIMEVLHTYREGYSKGYSDYVELNLLGIETGLFTK